MEKTGILFVVACLNATASAQKDFDQNRSILDQVMNAFMNPSAEQLPIYVALGLMLFFLAVVATKVFDRPGKKGMKESAVKPKNSVNYNGEEEEKKMPTSLSRGKETKDDVASKINADDLHKELD